MSVDVDKYRYLVLQAPINITFEQSSFFGIFIQGVCVWKESTYENDKYYAILKPVFLCFLGYIFFCMRKNHINTPISLDPTKLCERKE